MKIANISYIYQLELQVIANRCLEHANNEIL